MFLKKLFVKLLEKRYNPTHVEKFDNIKSILIRPLGYSIGDAVIHTAHLAQLRKVFSKIRLGVIVEGNNQIIFQASRLADEYVKKNISDILKNRKKWDLLIDFENNFTTSSLLIDRVLMPKKIMIFSKKFKKYYNLDTIKAYDIYSQIDADVPLSHYLSESLLGRLYSLPSPKSVLYSSLQSRKHVQSFWQEYKVRVLLCPQGSRRELPVNELANLLKATLLQLNRPIQISFLLSYTPTAQKYFNRLNEIVPKLSVSLSPKTSLEDYIALVESANIVIAVDGGSVHLACALKKPLLSFFANSHPNLDTFLPLTYPEIPHKRLVSLHKEGTFSNNTCNFDINEGAHWLSEQLIYQNNSVCCNEKLKSKPVK